MSLYAVLVVVHVFSAIIGIGPGFIMTFIAEKSDTMSQLRHAYYLRNRIHIFIMVGGTLLLITGIWMGFINPSLFAQGWYVISLVLYMITLAVGPMILAPCVKPIKDLLANIEGEEVPKEYHQYAKRLFFYERITNIILIIIIVLMVTKPF